MADDFHSDTDHEDDLNALLGEGWDQHSSEVGHADDSTPRPSEAVPAEAHEDGRARGADGKFVAREKPDGDEPVAPAPPQAPPAPAIDAPEAWAAHRAQWDALPDDAKRLIAERETSGRTVAERARAWEPVEQRLAAHDAQLAIAGTSRAQFISNLIGAHEMLMTRPQEALAAIAQQYRIPFPQAGQQVPQQEGQQADPNADMARRMAAMEQTFAQRQQQEQAAQHAHVQAQVQAFAAKTAEYPHFEAAKPVMAQLLQSGMANDLPDAYAKACRLDGTISQRIAEAATRAAQADKHRVAEEARRRASSVSGAPVRGATPATPERDLAAQLSADWDDLSS